MANLVKIEKIIFSSTSLSKYFKLTVFSKINQDTFAANAKCKNNQNCHWYTYTDG
jgi:hypothetical protein